MKLVLQIIIVVFCLYGAIIVGMDAAANGPGKFAGINAIAAIPGFFVIGCGAALLGVIIVGGAIQFLMWVFKSE